MQKTVPLLCALLMTTFVSAGVAFAEGDDDDDDDSRRAEPVTTADEPARPAESEEEATAPCAALAPQATAIVNGDRAYPFAPTHGRFFNWRLKKLAPKCWPTYTIATQLEFGGTAINPSYWQKGYGTIDAIVVHETAAERGLTRTDTGVHFLVERDGTIIQLADLNSRYNHASNSVVNNRAIGIEVSNEPFPDFATGAVRHSDGEVVKVPWAVGGTIALPPPAQLQALHELITALLALRETPTKLPLTHSGISVPARWHNFAINDEFLFTMSGYRIFNSSIDPHVWAGRTLVVETPGISSHSIIYDHGDGGAPLLYAWLAWKGRAAPWPEMKRILTGCTLHRLTATDPLVKLTPPVFGKDYEVRWIDGKRVVTSKEIATYPMARLLTFARNCTSIELTPAGELEEIDPAPAPPSPAPSASAGDSADDTTGGDSAGDGANPGPSNPPGADDE